MAINTRQAPDPMKQAAQRYAAQGWRIHPVHYIREDMHCSCGQKPCLDAGKHPYFKDWPERASNTELEVMGIWDRFKHANIALATGQGSNVVVIDVDIKSDGDSQGIESFARLTAMLGTLPDTLMARSGGGGWHYFFLWPGRAVPNATGGKKGGRLEEFKGVDVRGDGGYLLLPPSNHYTGGVYRWEKNQSGDWATPATLPDAWVEYITREMSPPRLPVTIIASTDPSADGSRAKWLPWAIDRASDGSRNDCGADLAAQLRDDGLSVDDAWPIMLEYQEAVTGLGRQPYTEREAMATLKSIYRTSPRERARGPSLALVRPDDDDELAARRRARREQDESNAIETLELQHYHLTQEGTAQRFIASHGHDFRFVSDWKHWLYFDGKRWRHDPGPYIERRCRQLFKDMQAEARALLKSDDPSDQAYGKKLALFALIKCETVAMMKAVITLAGSELAVTPDDLDRDHFKLTVNNGTIDLRTGQLLPHDRADMITKLAPVFYDPTAKAPIWEAFIKQVTDGRDDLALFLQRAAGYSITASRKEQVVFMPYGSGGNGKSVFLDTIKLMMGDYSAVTAVDTLVKRDGGQVASSEIARLHTVRCVMSSEPDEGNYLNEGLVKSMTGDGVMTGKFLYAEPFEFRPKLKLWLSTNVKPRLKDTGYSMRRRIRLIPFDVTIGEAQADKDLLDKLAGELPGILNWVLTGCLSWQRDGLPAPACVREATEEYIDEQDVMSSFISEHCVIGPQYTASATFIYAAYTQWCEENNERDRGKTWFGLKLGKRPGITKEHKYNGWFYHGIGLLAENPRPDDGLTGLKNATAQDTPDIETVEHDGSYPFSNFSRSAGEREIENSKSLGQPSDSSADFISPQDTPELAGILNPSGGSQPMPKTACLNCFEATGYIWTPSTGLWACKSCRSYYRD